MRYTFLRQPADKPDRLERNICHVKQRYTWDCGISCVLMILPETDRINLISNFHNICREEGFNKSTWTIDLCYLLSRYRIRHRFYTKTLGVHPRHKDNSFYTNVLSKDEDRVRRRFSAVKKNGIEVSKTSVSMVTLLAHLNDGPIIVLTNAKLLCCERCTLNKISTEIRKCIPWPVQYQGHYIVLCGYNIMTQKIHYRNPSFYDHVCVMSFEGFEKAWKTYGTDEDIIFIYD